MHISTVEHKAYLRFGKGTYSSPRDLVLGNDATELGNKWKPCLVVSLIGSSDTPNASI